MLHAVYAQRVYTAYGLFLTEGTAFRPKSQHALLN